jgi:hypothetical protein
MTSNSVTLEQLNAPTDQELQMQAIAHCIIANVGWKLVEPRISNYDPLGQCGVIMYNGRIVAELNPNGTVSPTRPSEAIHEDEELMLRIPLDEGV